MSERLAAGRVEGTERRVAAQGRREAGRQVEGRGELTVGAGLERETRGEATAEEKAGRQPLWWVLGGCRWRGCRDSRVASNIRSVPTASICSQHCKGPRQEQRTAPALSAPTWGPVVPPPREQALALAPAAPVWLEPQWLEGQAAGVMAWQLARGQAECGVEWAPAWLETLVRGGGRARAPPLEQQQRPQGRGRAWEIGWPQPPVPRLQTCCAGGEEV